MSTPWKNFYNWEPQREPQRELFAVFLRETQSISKLTADFGVKEGNLSIEHKFKGQALGGQVFWVHGRPETGFAVKPYENPRKPSPYTVYQCKPDLADDYHFVYRNPLAAFMETFLDRSWEPPKPGFTSIRGGQVDLKNRCCYKPGFGEFEWDDAPIPTEKDAIKIRGRWALENIERVQIPQLKGVQGVHGCVIEFNKKAVSQLKMLWQAWEECGLLSKIVMFSAGFVPRYQRNCNHTAISNHAFGTAFDINVPQNDFGCLPARLGEYGCVRQLAEVANQYGFYWGGHWGGLKNKGWDGMHFEVAKIM